jgi:hypothetical protein
VNVVRSGHACMTAPHWRGAQSQLLRLHLLLASGDGLHPPGEWCCSLGQEHGSARCSARTVPHSSLQGDWVWPGMPTPAKPDARLRQAPRSCALRRQKAGHRLPWAGYRSRQLPRCWASHSAGEDSCCLHQGFYCPRMPAVARDLRRSEPPRHPQCLRAAHDLPRQARGHACGAAGGP